MHVIYLENKDLQTLFCQVEVQSSPKLMTLSLNYFGSPFFY